MARPRYNYSQYHEQGIGSSYQEDLARHRAQAILAELDRQDAIRAKPHFSWGEAQHDFSYTRARKQEPQHWNCRSSTQPTFTGIFGHWERIARVRLARMGEHLVTDVEPK